MSPEVLYTTCVLGAVGLFLILRPGRRAPRLIGAVLALAALAWMLVNVPRAAGVETFRPEAFFVIFSLIAVASGARMITHPRPVYSALYFILVVLSSAALFLLMQAEFMAFALVIVYAGAILVTYVFVLMLAQQSPTADTETGAPEYDIVPREPAAAALVGFVMLALLSTMCASVDDVQPAPSPRQAREQLWARMQAMPRAFEEALAEADPQFNAWSASEVRVRADGTAYVEGTFGESSEVRSLELPDAALPSNPEQVGLGLVARFPVSLELAGVILLLAMFGAVVLARKQIELGEGELRDAAAAASGREGAP